jgi:hypothetical protein
VSKPPRIGAMPKYCIGAFLHSRQLIIPYAMSDSASTFATLSLDDVLAAME